MNAFVTGSRAYGTPRRTSDVDLVILCDEATETLLWTLGEQRDGSLYFGRLNLIVCTDEKTYAVWKVGTEACREKKDPVSREDAMAVLNGLRAMVGILDNYQGG
jgi:hypothetical protein